MAWQLILGKTLSAFIITLLWCALIYYGLPWVVFRKVSKASLGAILCRISLGHEVALLCKWVLRNEISSDPQLLKGFWDFLLHRFTWEQPEIQFLATVFLPITLIAFIITLQAEKKAEKAKEEKREKELGMRSIYAGGFSWLMAFIWSLDAAWCFPE